MEIIMKKVSELTPYGKNAKKHDEKPIANVAESIKEMGWLQPIVIDATGVVVVGHCRLMAAKKLKEKEVPCVIADDLTEEQIKKYRILDNKLNESPWDLGLLAEDIEGLDFSGYDLDLLVDDVQIGGGITADDIVEDDFDSIPSEQPKAKLGDVYKLGNHRLMCGNATSANDVETLLNGAHIDLIYTDPPYGMNAVSKSSVLSKKYKTDILGDDNNSVAIDCFNLCLVKFPDSKQVWFGANYYTECLPSSECWIVWDKNNGNSDQTDCELAWANFRSVVRQFTMASEKKNRVHPTQKPCKLFFEIVNRFDKTHGFINVLDLFGGSGSTLIACEQMDKKCFMMELDPKFVDVIIDRWEAFTGKKAILLNS